MSGSGRESRRCSSARRGEIYLAPTGEDALALWANPHRLAAPELELLEPVAREDRDELCTGLVVQLDPGVAPQHREADDHRLGGAVRRLREQLDVVGAHQDATDLVRVAHETHDELVRGSIVELARRPDLLEPTAVHHRDLVGNLHRLLLVVRHEDGCDVDDVVEPREPFAELGPDARVEGAERLVQEEHFGLGREGAREAMRCRWPPESCDG